ncbi:MAG: extracellular solute-binding protein [Betaproteobacteria bacterium]
MARLGESMNRRVLMLLLAAVAVVAGVTWNASHRNENMVVVYVSEDQVFSEPVLKDFERISGTAVRAVYDTEETKSAGVMNRLLAEKSNPQADVYWANEPIRAEVLRQQGISAPYFSPSAAGIPDRFREPHGYWTGFSARARMLIVAKGIPGNPTSVLAYTDSRFRSKAVIANPLFGTTTAHIAALFAVWGDKQGEAFLAAMRRNDVKLASSNGESADQVAAGTFQFALADSDDIHSRQSRGLPVEGVYPDQGEQEVGCFIVPNAVVLINGGPHLQAGRKLIDYLLSRETEKKLAYSDAAQIPLHPDVETPADVRRLETLKIMKVDYAQVAAKMQAIQPLLKDWAGH